jgi:hypothetical protein
MDLKNKRKIIKGSKIEDIFNDIYLFMIQNNYNFIQLENPVKIIGKKKVKLGILDKIFETLKEGELHVGLWNYNHYLEIVFDYSVNVTADIHAIEDLLFQKYVTSSCKKENDSGIKTKATSNEEFDIKETLNNKYQQLKQDFLEEKKCPSCHKNVKKNWIFCPYCGHALKSNSDNIVLKNVNNQLDNDYIEDRISRKEYLKRKEELQSKHRSKM